MDTEKLLDEKDELIAHEDQLEVPVEPEEKVIEGKGSVDHNGEEEKDKQEKSVKENVASETSVVASSVPQPAAEKPAGEHGDNVAFVNSQIEKLIGLKDEKNFSDFWFYVRELNKMIFTLRGLQKEERSKFKERIGELCDETKKSQEEYKSKISKTSSVKLDRIRQMIDEALAFGTAHEELEKSFHKIEEANKFLREGKVQSEEGEETDEMSREDREQAIELVKAG